MKSKTVLLTLGTSTVFAFANILLVYYMVGGKPSAIDLDTRCSSA